jgi:hypothetical protein
VRWFGGLIPAYELIGYTGHRPYTRANRRALSNGRVTARLSDDQLIDLLRGVLQKHGFLNMKIINQSEGVPSARTYAQRFGGMKRAYRLAGFTPAQTGGPCSPLGRRALSRVMSKSEMLASLRRLLRKHGKLTEEIITASAESPSTGTYVTRFGSMRRAYSMIGYDPGPRYRRCLQSRKMSDALVLDGLRKLLRKHGRLARSERGQGAGDCSP